MSNPFVNIAKTVESGTKSIQDAFGGAASGTISTGTGTSTNAEQQAAAQCQQQQAQLAQQAQETKNEAEQKQNDKIAGYAAGIGTGGVVGGFASGT